ncbi:glycosyltransferase [Fusobacterium nucleatum]|uniref:glycosyltransferase n=1 Tax=Fusobacterium animalis TaxID=76859 RepID=UPI001C6E9C14|nr:glycosyltransferase [Fusobacterium animalis]QYR63962.1 glycosyltransferase [Fusobacterium animalis]
MIEVSIVVPVYNVEKYLEKCLYSIYALNLSNKEVILVNDGSTDLSIDILNKFKNKYPNETKIITQKNQGLSEARNTGLKNSRGEYILFIDSDDFIDSKETEIFLNFGIKQKVDILIGNYKEYYNDNEIKYRDFYKIKETEENEGMFFIENGFINKCFEFVVWRNIYRRKFLLENNLFFKKSLLHEDNLFTPIAFFYAKKVRCFNKKFYFYRKNNLGSIMQTKNKKNYEHMLYTINKLLEFIKIKDIKNEYFNRIILGIYINILRQGEYKNKDILCKIRKLKFNFREKLKLVYIFIFQKLYNSKLEELEMISLDKF